MTSVEESIEVAVPVTVAYNQWSQFEEFPNFMEGVERVEQLTDTRNRWNVNIGGVERKFETEITEQTPDQRIAWHTVAGPKQAGVVTFHRLDDEKCKVMLQMDFDPEGMSEQIADKLGLVKRRVKGDLERFKEFIESRGTETGAWRGEVNTSKQA